VKARLTDGSLIELVKDCDCLTHEGPHWLHMDALARRINQPLFDRAATGAPMAVAALATEEIARLRLKRYEMKSRRIAQLLP
jgi:hypothetical protein